MMGFNKLRLKEMQKKLDALPLWKLIIYTANIEKSLVELRKQGLSSKNHLMQRTKWKRSYYRNLLRKKLIKWKKNPDSVNDVMDFASVQINKYEEELNILEEK